MSESAADGLDSILAQAVPEFGRWARTLPEWDPDASAQRRAFLLLELLRLWLFDEASDARLEPAWGAVERLAGTDDPVLLNAVVVGLLEGDWPARHVRAMGPRTQELRREPG